MHTVELQTDNGGFVVKGSIPPFVKGMGPEVIYWGSRTFKFYGFTNDTRHIAIYREVFAVALVLTEQK